MPTHKAPNTVNSDEKEQDQVKDQSFNQENEPSNLNQDLMFEESYFGLKSQENTIVTSNNQNQNYMSLKINSIIESGNVSDDPDIEFNDKTHTNLEKVK